MIESKKYIYIYNKDMSSTTRLAYLSFEVKTKKK